MSTSIVPTILFNDSFYFQTREKYRSFLVWNSLPSFFSLFSDLFSRSFSRFSPLPPSLSLSLSRAYVRFAGPVSRSRFWFLSFYFSASSKIGGSTKRKQGVTASFLFCTGSFSSFFPLLSVCTTLEWHRLPAQRSRYTW